MNNNNKSWNKNGYKENEANKENYNKNASQSSQSGMRNVEPKQGKTESSKELNQPESREQKR